MEALRVDAGEAVSGAGASAEEGVASAIAAAVPVAPPPPPPVLAAPAATASRRGHPAPAATSHLSPSLLDLDWSRGHPTPAATASRRGHPASGRTEDGRLSWKKAEVLSRLTIRKAVADNNFGRKTLGYDGDRVSIFDKAASVARRQTREVDVVTTVWRLDGDAWLNRPVNLQSRLAREERAMFQCLPDVYSYNESPVEALVVDFANRHVGGGCFARGFVQEEQMVAQSSDFACQLKLRRPYIEYSAAISYDGIHMDTWWTRQAAAKKGGLAPGDIQDMPTGPFSILAVDAPHMRGGTYSYSSLGMLARKVLLIFEVAEQKQSPAILTGLLGGGAFRNNRPLVLLLHLLCQTSDSPPVSFHNPILWSFCELRVEDLQDNILRQADQWMDELRTRGVRTLKDALEWVMERSLPLSINDDDLRHLLAVR